MQLSPGSNLSRYEIVAFLDAGGMGDVYRARDPKLGREVAIKVLPTHWSQDERARARFEREARAVASLSHPNILSIHDVGREDETFFAVTELLDGETLHRRLASGALPIRHLLPLGRGMAEGLAAAHARGVVHRDLKPKNVFLTRDDRVKILDFGVASLQHPEEPEDQAGAQDGDDRPTAVMEPASTTLPGEVVGTAGYLSPEQARGEAVDGRSDIFALGCVLYEMLTGTPAFVRDNPVDTLLAVLREEPPAFPEDAPIELCEIIRQCLRKDPKRRFQSAHDVALCLRLVADPSRPVSSPSTSVRIDPAPEARRRPRRAWVLVPLALAAGLACGWWLKPPEQTPPASLQHLTHTGRDREPAASHDGKRVAFSSDRDGRDRIWIKQLAGGDETPITAGSDRSPRFSPDDANRPVCPHQR